MNSSLLALEIMQSRGLSVILPLNIQFHKFRTVTCIAKCNSQRRVTWGRMSRPNERQKQSQWLPRICTAGLSGPTKPRCSGQEEVRVSTEDSPPLPLE